MNDQTALVPSEAVAKTQGAALVTAQSREVAQQQALFIMARQFPRDLDVFREKVLRECKNATFAELAIYDLPFGKEHVRGGSIRLAEGVFRAMQNFALDVRMVADTPTTAGRPGFQTWRAEMLDLENGTPSADETTVEKTVERRSPPSDRPVLSTRTTSEGNVVFICEATAAELLAKANSAKSKMRRNLILARIETSIMDEIKAELRKTNESEASRDPDEARRRMLDGFANVGVDADELKRYCGQELSTLSPKQIVDLRELWAAINDGFCTWADALADKGIGPNVTIDGEEDPTPVGGLMERIKARQDASKSGTGPKPSEAPKQQEGPPPRASEPSTPKRSRKDLLDAIGRGLKDAPAAVGEAAKAEIKRQGKTKIGDMDDAGLASLLAVLEKEIARESH